MSPAPHSREMELYLLGTGTSSAVPSIGCLTSPETGCYCCRSTLPSSTDPLGKYNVRRNTGAVLRVPSDEPGGRTRSLVIDCGKTFWSAAMEHWPKKGFREIDALLITHPHADAILGLDDLRGWTLHQNVQDTIDIFVNQFTFDEISKTFPYLTDIKKATGGGDVPALTWNIIDDSKPFEILGVRIVPLPVHHGKFFTSPPTPYLCLGFLFASRLVYLSDVSNVPNEVWTILERECTLGTAPTPDATTTAENGIAKLAINGAGINSESKPRVHALVVDCLRIDGHMSHFGLGQAVETARRIGADRSYLVGFGHQISHASWVNATAAFSAGATTSLPVLASVRAPKPEHMWQHFSGSPTPGVEDMDVFREHALQGIESWEGGAKGGFWIRPAVDGMSIRFGGEKGGDDFYE